MLRIAKPGVSGIKTVVELQVHAFVFKARTSATDTQTVYIVVQDQNLQPVNNASCEVTVRLPDGTSERGVFISEKGVCTLSFQFKNQRNGSLVYIDVKVSYDDISAKTITSFRIWE